MLSSYWRSELLTLCLAITAASASGGSSQPSCTTVQGYAKPYSVPTKSTTLTVTSTKKVTSYYTPTVTITASPSTVVATVSSTSTKQSIAPVQTVTVTVTSTTSPVVTSAAPTVTSLVTDVETDTTTTSLTYTVPTPNGFVPVASSLPDAVSYKKRQAKAPRNVGSAKRGSSLAVRALDMDLQSLPVTILPSAAKQQLQKRSYAQSVSCQYTSTTVVTTTIKSTAPALTRTKSSPAVTSTTTIIVTATSVVQALPQTTTTTLTATSPSTALTTPIATSTVTSTTVQTSTSTIGTYYAACASGTSNNLVWDVETAYIQTLYTTGGSAASGITYKNLDIDDAYSCCAACFENPQCAFSAVLPGVGCYLAVTSGTCSALNQYSGTIEIDGPGTATEGSYVVSNGNCGQIDTVLVSCTSC